MKSIFDIIEAQKEKPAVFEWTKQLPSFNPSESLYEGALTTMSSSEPPKPYKFVLTFQGLFKYKVIYQLFNR